MRVLSRAAASVAVALTLRATAAAAASDPLAATPPAGFVAHDPIAADSRHWLRSVDGHAHAIDVRVTSDASFASVGSDVTTLGPQIADKMKAAGYTIERSGPRLLCGGARGFEIHGTETTDAGLLHDDIVLAVAHATLYEAVYTHDLGTPALPDALAFIDALCPRSH